MTRAPTTSAERSESPRLGAKVRALRRREALTQVQLAAQLGISASYLNLIEANRRPMPANVLIKLAQLFGVDVGADCEELDFAADQLLPALRQDVIRPQLRGVRILRPLADEHHPREHERVVLRQHDAERRVLLRADERIRAKLSSMHSEGKPLVDDFAVLRVRLARPGERALYYERSSLRANDSSTLMVYLVDLDDPSPA